MIASVLLIAATLAIWYQARSLSSSLVRFSSPTEWKAFSICSVAAILYFVAVATYLAWKYLP